MATAAALANPDHAPRREYLTFLLGTPVQNVRLRSGRRAGAQDKTSP